MLDNLLKEVMTLMRETKLKRVNAIISEQLGYYMDIKSVKAELINSKIEPIMDMDLENQKVIVTIKRLDLCEHLVFEEMESVTKNVWFVTGLNLIEQRGLSYVAD